MKAGIVTAFGMESRPLRIRMEEIDRTSINGYVCYRLLCHGEEVTVVQSSMGTKRSEEATRLLVERFGTKVVVNCGTAGAISPQRNIGDVVVADEVVVCDMNPSRSPETPVYRPDQALLGMSLQVSSSGLDGVTVLAGIILSGDQVVNSQADKETLWNRFQGQCVEQEGAGVARMCQELHIPWMVIRGISDLADGHVMRDFHDNSQCAAANAADAAFKLISQLITIPDIDHLKKMMRAGAS